MPVFTITARELTPEGAKVASVLQGLTALGLVATVPYAVLQFPQYDHINVLAAATAAAVFCYQTIKGVISVALARRTCLRLSIAEVAVRRLSGWKRYSRELAHQFVLLPHDRARDEQRDNDFRKEQAGRKGEPVKPSVFYGESFHVVLSYAGQRIDLLTVYGPVPAAAIVARLQLCDDLLNRAAGKNHSTGGGAEDEWSRDAPGGLS